VAQQDVVVPLDQGLFVVHRYAPEVVRQCHRDSILGDGNEGQFNWLLALSDPGALICLFDLRWQIATVVECSDTPAAIFAQAAHDASRVNHRAGRLQVFATISNSRGLSFFYSDFGIVGFAAL